MLAESCRYVAYMVSLRCRIVVRLLLGCCQIVVRLLFPQIQVLSYCCGNYNRGRYVIVVATALCLLFVCYLFVVNLL